MAGKKRFSHAKRCPRHCQTVLGIAKRFLGIAKWFLGLPNRSRTAKRFSALQTGSSALPNGSSALPTVLHCKCSSHCQMGSQGENLNGTRDQAIERIKL
jgi:hypothetical protein